MRSLFKFIIAALILTACSQTPILPTATPLPSMTPTRIPTVTPTFLPTFTSTPTPGFDPKTMDKPEIIMFTDPVENVNVGGVTINGAFAVAESAFQAGVHEVTMPDELGGEILSEAVFMLDFYHGNNPHATNVEPTETDRAEFFERWAKVQNGELPCSAIQVRPFAFDAKVAGAEQQQIPLEIMCGKGVSSAGARQIDKVEIQIVKGYGTVNEAEQRFEHSKDYPRMVLTGAKSMGNGFETEISGNRLVIKVGVTWKMDKPTVSVALLISDMFDFLRINNGKPTQILRLSSNDEKTAKEWISSGFEVK